MRPGGSPNVTIDTALLVAVKRSEVYRALRSRVADPRPQDAWIDAGRAFVVFTLHPVVGGKADSTASSPAQVLFVLGALMGTLLATRLVELDASGKWRTYDLCDADGGEVPHAEVDLRPL